MPELDKYISIHFPTQISQGFEFGIVPQSPPVTIDTFNPQDYSLIASIAVNNHTPQELQNFLNILTKLFCDYIATNPDGENSLMYRMWLADGVQNAFNIDGYPSV
jgi:hypothetical protein